MTRTTTIYHVTSAESAEAILRDGFHGNWGDVGFGVYAYGALENAEAYRDRGGWDGRLDPASAVILAIEVPESGIKPVTPHPDWPDPEAYEDVVWHEMDDDDEEACWTPARSIVVSVVAAPEP